MSPETGLRRESQHRVPHALVRSQLETVLASELFSRSERLSGFLRFVVEETLNGRGETLKELVLAHQLYGKEADFDGAISPIVRVDARRLRDKLREYYANRPSDPVVISLPKGSYVPTFERFGARPPSAMSKLSLPRRRLQTRFRRHHLRVARRHHPDGKRGSGVSRRSQVSSRWCSLVRMPTPAGSRNRPHRPVGSCWRSCRSRTSPAIPTKNISATG